MLPTIEWRPWRRDFDAARDPYTARVALGITTTGGGGGGITDAPSDGTLYGRLNGAWSPAQAAGSYAPINSPTFTGDPKAPTPATGDNDTSVATTAFVKAQGYLVSADVSGLAPIASPTFTGDPKAPTPATADNDTSIATIASVKANLAKYQPRDADLTSIAGYGSTGTWLYRSAADTWSPVTVGSGLSFAAGTLSASGTGTTTVTAPQGRLTLQT